MKLTKHAKVRMDQRGIEQEVAEVVYHYARQGQARDGAIYLFFGDREHREALEDLRREKPPARELARRRTVIERARRIRLIERDSAVLTMYRGSKPVASRKSQVRYRPHIH